MERAWSKWRLGSFDLQWSISIVLLARLFVEFLPDVRGGNGFCLLVELDEFVADVAPDVDSQFRTGILKIRDDHLFRVWKFGTDHRPPLLQIKRVFLCLPCFAHHHNAPIALLQNLLDALAVPVVERLETADEDTGFH